MAVVFLLLAAAERTSRARPFWEMLPEPFSSARFDRLMEFMQLDHAQRLAVEAAHERHKQRFKELHERELSPFAIRYYEIRWLGHPFDGRIVDQLFRDRKQLADRMMMLDHDLFEEISPLLRDDQQPRLDRARRQRERDFFSTFDWPDAEVIEFSELVASLRLPAELEEAIEPLLTTWESAYTAALRGIHEHSLAAERRVLDTYARFNTDTSMDDETLTALLVEELDEFTEQARAESARLIEASHGITRRAAARIDTLLPPAESRRFRRMTRARFHGYFFPDYDSVEPVFDYALAQESLADFHAELETMFQTYEIEVETVNREIVRVDETFAEAHPALRRGMDVDDEIEGRYWQSMNQLFERREALNERHQERLRELLGEAFFDHLDTRGMNDLWFVGEAEHFFVDHDDDEAGFDEPAKVEDEGLVDEATNDSTLLWREAGLGDLSEVRHRPLTRADLQVWTVRLNATDDQRDILFSLFDHYREDYEAAVRGPVSGLLKPLMDVRIESRDYQAAIRHAIAFHEAHTKARELFAAVDQEFLASIGVLLEPSQSDAFAAVQRSLERRHLLGTYDWSDSQYDYVWIAEIDLVRFLMRSRWSPEVWRAIETPLRSYEEETIPLLAQRRKTAHERYMLQLRGAELWRDGQAGMEAKREVDRAWREKDDEGNEIDRQLLARAERAVDTFLQLMPPEDAAVFEREINQRLYPEIHPDPNDALSKLRRAMALRDLAPAARAGIETLIDEHTREHRRLSAELVRLSRARRGLRDTDLTIMQDQHRTTYNRREWNATTLRRLRALLTEEQAKRVPGLNRWE